MNARRGGAARRRLPGAAFAAAGLRWRLAHVARRAAERGSAAALRQIAGRALLRRLPRAAVLPLERLLIRSVDGTPFDAAGYLERNPDVRDSGHGALDHYLRWGWSEGRAPRAGFADAAAVRGVPVSALARELAERRGRPAFDPAPPPGLPSLEELLERLEALGPRPADPVVDVIVPVYRGRIETLNCLVHALEAENRTPANLLVIDDHGPDSRLRADLRRLARGGLIELVVQPRNLGFVAAVNAGMACHPERDVVWLNADTEPHGDWIDRLRAVAEGDSRIATVTPLTNNGTIASYPHFDRDNPEPLEAGWAEIDRLAAAANGTSAVDAPTCVGFCTYVRRRAIREVGCLDQAAFGRGYGEENDFSCRAAALGWRNVIAGGIFVRHLGAASFGPERAARVDAAMRVMAERHPAYPWAIRRFAAADPVAPMREALDLARLAAAGARGPGKSERSAPRDVAPRVFAPREAAAVRSTDDRPAEARSPAASAAAACDPVPPSPPPPSARTVLIVSHGRGGGTERHVRDEVARLAGRGLGAVLMTGGEKAGCVRLGRSGLGPAPSLEAVPFSAAGLARLCRRLGVAEIHVHHLIEMPADAPERLIWLADALDVPIEVTVHDYFALCPRINLTDARGRYCGEPGPAGCRRCLRTRRSDAGAPEIGSWRAAQGRLLAAARLIKVPDSDVADRLRRHFGALGRIAVVPHEDVARPPIRHAAPDGPLRVAVIGAIGPIKGFDVLLGLAGHVRRSGARAELTVIGYTRNDAAARAAGIAVTGRYAEGDVPALLEQARADLVFIPSTWPETFCYTLSHALRSPLPVAAFDLGAPAARLRALGEDALVPLALADDPAALLDRLTEIARGPLWSREAAPGRATGPELRLDIALHGGWRRGETGRAI